MKPTTTARKPRAKRMTEAARRAAREAAENYKPSDAETAIESPMTHVKCYNCNKIVTVNTRGRCTKCNDPQNTILRVFDMIDVDRDLRNNTKRFYNVQLEYKVQEINAEGKPITPTRYHHATIYANRDDAVSCAIRQFIKPDNYYRMVNGQVRGEVYAASRPRGADPTPLTPESVKGTLA